MRVVEISTLLDAPRALVWAYAKNGEQLADATAGFVAFDGLPDGDFEAGHRYDLRISIFGLTPWVPYSIEILEMDEAAGLIRSTERGAGIRSWRHDIHITDEGDGTRLTDRVEIDAGWKTGIVALWAHVFYRHRHRRRTAALAAAQHA